MPPSRWPILKLIALATLSAAALAALMNTSIIPNMVDWRQGYRLYALTALGGQSPYSTGNFYNPPWALLPALPLALLPEKIGGALWFALGFVGFAVAGHRLGAGPVSLVALLLSPFVILNQLNGNIDWLPLLGFTLPPPVGLFLILIKPQMGLGLAVYWAAEALQRRAFLRTVAPVALVFALSLALYGAWPLQTGRVVQVAQAHNTSLWPWGAGVGLALLALALKQRAPRWAMASGPFLSPYLLLHSWVSVFAPALPSARASLAVCALGWALVAARLALIG
jgi:hypothetical protein